MTTEAQIIKDLFNNEFDKIDGQGLKQGYHRTFNNGRLFEIQNYVDGNRTGYRIHYYESGEIEYIQQMVNGRIDGVGIRFYESNKVEFISKTDNNVCTYYIQLDEKSNVIRTKFKSNRELFMVEFEGNLVPYYSSGCIFTFNIKIDESKLAKLYSDLTFEEITELAEVRKNRKQENLLDDYPTEMKLYNKFKNLAIIEDLKLRY
jgi:hypothetical protein